MLLRIAGLCQTFVQSPEFRLETGSLVGQDRVFLLPFRLAVLGEALIDPLLAPVRFAILDLPDQQPLSGGGE